MRTLMWFTIGFAAACFVGTYLLSGVWLIVLLICALCGMILLFLLKRKPCVIAGVILLGLCVGIVWQSAFNGIYLQPLQNYDEKSATTQIIVTDYSYDTDYGIAADGQVYLEGKQYNTRVYMTGAESLSPGDTVTGTFRFRLTTEQAAQGATYHQGNGIFLLSYADKDAKVTFAENVPIKYFAAKLRRGITDILDAAFPEDTLAFARALLLGDSSLLTYEEDTALKVSGIRHVIAVSGLHVSILFGLIYALSGRKRIQTAVLGIPVLILFAAVAGFTPSIVRACIMQILMILALLLNKEYDPPTALAFAVLTMLTGNPLTITSVSFQLSVGCLVGILLFYQPIYRYLVRLIRQEKGMSRKAKFGRWLAGSVSVTVSAMSVTTPLSAWYFGSISLVGVLTNLLTLWVISFVFYGVMLICVLGTFWVTGATAVATVISWPIRYVLVVAKGLSRVPFAAVYTCSVYVVAWLIFVYLLFSVFLLCKKKHPVVLSSCVLCGLIVALLLSWIEPKLDSYRATVLDVGQGQSILLQSNGKNYMVDCGGDDGETAADIAAQTLLSQGITKLDGLILTHFDDDHAGGVPALLSRIPAQTLYLPDIEDTGDICDLLEQQYEDSISWIGETTLIGSDNVQLTLIPAAVPDKGNESSLCILFQTKNCDILITGDRNISGERSLIDSIALPQLELLVVGHHGSNTSTGLELLNATKPKTAVISVGEDNSYGHPTEAVLKRLDMFGCKIWRTDLHGTIIFRG